MMLRVFPFHGSAVTVAGFTPAHRSGLRPTLAIPGLRPVLCAVAIAVLALSGVPAFAADDDSKVIFPAGTPKSETAAMPKGGSLNSVTLIVGLMLAGVGGWLVWRNRRSTTSGRSTSALAVEETRSLGNRQYLVVASYEGRKFLLGVCPGQINMLAPLDDEAGASRVSE